MVIFYKNMMKMTITFNHFPSVRCNHCFSLFGKLELELGFGKYDTKKGQSFL